MLEWLLVDEEEVPHEEVLAYFPQTDLITLATEQRPNEWYSPEGHLIDDPKQRGIAIQASHFCLLERPEPPQIVASETYKEWLNRQ